MANIEPLFFVLVVLFAVSGPLRAQEIFWKQMFVSPAGSDANDCVLEAAPCGSIQGSVDKIPDGSRAYIKLAPGTYNDAHVSVVYHRVVMIVGEFDELVASRGPAEYVYDFPMWSWNRARILRRARWRRECAGAWEAVR